MALQVDLAPTFLGIAGLPKPPQMDGKSLLPLLTKQMDTALPPTVAAHLADVAPKGTAAYLAGWRDSAFIECRLTLTACLQPTKPVFLAGVWPFDSGIVHHMYIW